MKNPCKCCDMSFYGMACYKCTECHDLQNYKNYLESRRKYQHGDKIKTIQEFEEEIANKNSVYWGDKIWNWAAISNQQYAVISQSIRNGSLYYAVKKENEK